MTVIPVNRETVVNTLRVTGPAAGAAAARQVGVLLRSLSLHPPSLPQSAIVFIRTLRDPLPGNINLQRNDGLPPAPWVRAVGDAIDRLARNAARPAKEIVPANAEAVLFADRSELLSCLAADWLAGGALARWWWRTLVRVNDVASAVISEWLSSVECAPAAFAKLAQKDLAVRFAGALEAAAVGRLLDEIIRHHGLVSLNGALQASLDETGAGASRVLDDHHGPPGERREDQALDGVEAAELRELIPEAFAAGLGPRARILLGAALMLERAPAALRDRRFALRLTTSLWATNLFDNIGRTGAAPLSPSRDANGADSVESGTEISPRPRSASGRIEFLPAGVEANIPQESPLAENRIQHETSNTRAEEPRDPRRARQSRSVPSVVQEEAQREQAQRRRGADVNVARLEPPAFAETPVPQTKATAATIELAIETKMGGAFYLINAALALNLYGDFTTPLEPGIDLSIWDFIALIGRRFVGERIEDDPIWQFLARLAGRFEGTHTREEPGARFKPPDEWRVPPDWLEAFPEREGWSYRINRGRLIVGHPAGFDVLDLKLGSRFSMRNITAKLESETLRYQYVGEIKQRRAAPRDRGTRKRERDLDRWTQLMADYFGPRLARSLGIGTADDLAEILFARAARVNATPARLDVFFSLADLPIEIRLAGLDRDPGWMPAAGRAIAFHYE